MKKINLADIPESNWSSPKGRFATVSKEISVALGRQPDSTDRKLRHPFDVEILKVPAGKAACPYHSHSAQWEYYQVISGSGKIRHKDGETSISAGDAFVFQPGEEHQLLNPSESDLTILIVADNPIGESCYYPDSQKWLVRSPDRNLIRSAKLDYFDGEE